jgi:hypothetical protein
MLAMCFVAARLLLVAGGRSDFEHNDTPSYRQGISLIGNAPRTWVIPLLLELPDAWVVVAQALLGGIAFFLLAVALAARVEHHRVRIAIAAVVMAIGLTPRVTYWDTMLLSESLAISLTALLIGAVVHLGRVPAWAFIALFTLWLFTRDGHTYLGALLVLVLGWWGWRHRKLAIPVGCLVVLGWSFVAASNDKYVEGSTAAAGMAYYSLEDVDNFRWLVEHGMPVSGGFSSAIEETTEIGAMQTMFRAIYFHDAQFRAWADEEGQALYLRFLLAHPEYLVERLPNAIVDGGFFDEALVDHTAYARSKTPGIPWVWPEEASWYTFVLVSAALVASLWVARAGLIDRRWIVPGAIAASSIPHAWMALIASPFEYGRHGVVMAFALVISAWWALALCADATLAKRPNRLVAPEDGAIGDANGEASIVSSI